MSLFLISFHLWNREYLNITPTIPAGSATIENCDFLNITGEPEKSILLFTSGGGINIAILMKSCRFYQCTPVKGQYCISASGYTLLSLQSLCFYLGIPQLLHLHTPPGARSEIENCQIYGGKTTVNDETFAFSFEGNAMNPSNLNFSFLAIYCVWGTPLEEDESIGAKFVSSSDLSVDYYFRSIPDSTHSFTSCNIFRNSIGKRFVSILKGTKLAVTLTFEQSIFKTTNPKLDRFGYLNLNGCSTDLEGGTQIAIANPVEIQLPIKGMDLGDECYRDPTLNGPRFYELEIYYVKAICGYFNLAVFTVVETDIFMIESHATNYRQ